MQHAQSLKLFNDLVVVVRGRSHVLLVALGGRRQPLVLLRGHDDRRQCKPALAEREVRKRRRQQIYKQVGLLFLQYKVYVSNFSNLRFESKICRNY